MPEIDLMRVDQCVVDVKLDDSSLIEAPGFGRFDMGSVEVEVKLEESDCLMKKSVERSGRRGRPPRTLAKASSSPQCRKKREDEDVCFVCFDGGSLVLCDRRGCPKAYHPACVKRTEAFFRSRAKWNCGWHICTGCQKDSFYMCYTCPYSVCKRCVRSSEYVVVQENKGFCGICMKTILLIENAADANKEKVQVDFDDQGSWEYLFKIYWVSLKEKLSLSLDDLTKAKNPWKSSSSTASKRRTTSMLHENDGSIFLADNSSGVIKASHAKVRKTEKFVSSLDSSSSLGGRLPPLTGANAWATDQLLDFVGYMRNGDTSVLSKYDVQTLVLEHVRRHNLQNPKSSEIICDPKLMRLFGKERVDHLEMLQLLDSHFLDQKRSPVTYTSGGGVTETVSFQVDRSRDRLLRFEQHQEGQSQQLIVHNIQPGLSTSDSRNHTIVKSETCATFSVELPSAHATLSGKSIEGSDANSLWLYGDPDGKIHGPFSLLNLRQWNSSGHFPPELRIWRLNEQQNNSILLTDALNGEFHYTESFQNHYIPKQELTAIADDQNRKVAVSKVETRVLDFSPNSVSTDQSVMSSSNSVITRNSDASNKSGNNFSHTAPLEFALSSERENIGSVSIWNKSKEETHSLGQSPISCSLSLATFPGNSNCSHPYERWNISQSGNEAKTASNQNGIDLSITAEKQPTPVGNNTVQSCGQNWNATTPSSTSNVWDLNSGLVSFTDNQEIDFLDLFSPTFKLNFASTTTDWQPIVADPDDCDESVSDLLAEVEAMESEKRQSSPTSSFTGPGELLRHSINNSFSSADGHSPALDITKGDSMSSTNDLPMQSRSNNTMDF